MMEDSVNRNTVQPNEEQLSRSLQGPDESRHHQFLDSDGVSKLNPLLPNEILYKLLGYVEEKQLLACRSLSKSWNEIASYHLARRQFPIKFFKAKQEELDHNPSNEDIHGFLQTMERRMDGPFPFVAFEFYFTSHTDYKTKETIQVPSLSTIEMFKEAMGTHVKSYSVHLEHFYEAEPSVILESLLRGSPNLERLQIYGQNSEAQTFITFPSSLVLPKLKRLILMPYSPSIGWIPTDSDHDGTGKFSFSQITPWTSLSQAPALQKFHSGFGVAIKSQPEADNLLDDLEQFHQVELELKTEDEAMLRELTQNPISTLHTLILDVEGVQGPSLISGVLTSAAGTLKRLRLKLYGSHNQIPTLPHLNTLELDFAEEEAEYAIDMVLDGPLHQAQFPMLKSLILKSYQSTTYEDRMNEDWSLFEGSVFETVVHLELIDYHRPRSEPWSLIFPNLQANEMYINQPPVHGRGEYATNDKIQSRDMRQCSIRQLNIRSTYTNSERQILLRPEFTFQ